MAPIFAILYKTLCDTFYVMKWQIHFCEITLNLVFFDVKICIDLAFLSTNSYCPLWLFCKVFWQFWNHPMFIFSQYFYVLIFIEIQLIYVTCILLLVQILSKKWYTAKLTSLFCDLGGRSYLDKKPLLMPISSLMH